MESGILPVNAYMASDHPPATAKPSRTASLWLKIAFEYLFEFHEIGQ